MQNPPVIVEVFGLTEVPKLVLGKKYANDKRCLVLPRETRCWLKGIVTRARYLYRIFFAPIAESALAALAAAVFIRSFVRTFGWSTINHRVLVNRVRG
ncbi:hypothetical protein M0804_010864 [Polistes exclamans]|nr:hypothetical protein M0804_010864 [Polistes exclamans]